MELLTGKAKESFTEYVYKEHARDASYQHGSFYDLPEICQNALIIDWFDSVELIIEITYGRVSESFICRVNEHIDTLFPSRKSATRAAIKRANTIFNER